MVDTLAAPSTVSRATEDTAFALDFLTYGEAMALFIAEAEGDLASVERFTRRIAGADLNVATGLARLQLRVGYISRVGKDAFGRLIINALQVEGIDASHVTVDPRYATGMQLKAKAPAGADPEIEYFRRGSAASHLSVADLAPDYVDGAARLHLTGVAPAISASSRALALALAQRFHAAGKPISFDPNLRPSLWPSQAEMVATLNEIASYATWVLPGLSEGVILTKATTPEGVADFYLNLGVKGVIVKLGETGAFFASHDGSRGYVEAHPVNVVVDTVGAGDGFAVGVISALAEGRTLEAAAVRGALIGALAIQVVGDSEGLPSRQQLTQLESTLIRNLHASNGS